MSSLRLVHRSLKGGGRALLCGFLGAFLALGGLSAQEIRETVGPVEKRTNPITPENPIPRRTFSVTPIYPAEAAGIDAAGSVSLVITIDETGRVVEIRKARDPLVITPLPTPSNQASMRVAREALLRESAFALRRWTYEPPAAGPMAFTILFSFRPGADATLAQSTVVAAPASDQRATSTGATATPAPQR